MDEYEQLLKDLETLLKTKRTIRCEDLLAWGRERNVGPVTLLSLVEDLVQKGIAEPSAEQELVDDFLELSLPKRLSLKQVQPPSSYQAPRAAQHRRKRRVGKAVKRDELLRFLYEQEGGAEETAQDKTEGLQRGGEEGLEPQTPLEEPRGEHVREEGVPEEREYVLALQYLYRFWSVGELRFEADLKSMGVRDATSLIRRLQSEGLVEIADPGVINAKRELIEKRLKELKHSLTPSPLADLFG
ncbi:MAG: hypothetical protein QW324_02230 [Thermofilaceae archaeon]